MPLQPDPFQMYLASGGQQSSAPERPAHRGPSDQSGGPAVIESPIQGVVKTSSRESQPPGTCWDAVNMVPYDKYGRKRVAQRTGIVKEFPNPLGDSAITSLAQVITSFNPTLLKTRLLLDETWNYAKGNLYTVASSTWARSGAADLLDVNGYQTGLTPHWATIPSDPSPSEAADYIGGALNSETVPGGLLNPGFAIINSLTIRLNTSSDGDILGIWYGIFQSGDSTGPYVGVEIDNNTDIITTTYTAAAGGGYGNINQVTVSANGVSGIVEAQFVLAGSTLTVNLLINGTVIVSASNASSTFPGTGAGLLLSPYASQTSGTANTMKIGSLQVWNISALGGDLPVDETFPYAEGDFPAVTPFWKIDTPKTTNAGLWTVPSGGGLINYNPSLALNGVLQTISWVPGLSGLGQVFSIAATITSMMSEATNVNDYVEFHIQLGDYSQYYYDVVAQLLSTDGSTIVPLIICNVYTKTKLLESMSFTPSGVTDTFAGILEVQVDETTVGGSTIRVYWAGTLGMSFQTPYIPDGVSIGFGEKIHVTSSSQRSNISASLSEFQIASGVTLPNAGAIAESVLISTCNGFVWLGTIPQGTATIQLATNQYVAPLAANVIPGVAGIFQEVYFVDGLTIAQLDIPSGAMVTYTPTAETPPTGCILACNWRGRLVLSGDPDNPQNFYMSRSGTPTDWDYSKTDAGAAVVGNASTYGQIGEAITALIPYSDDTLFIGCAHSLWMMQGDPTDGGTLILVSDNMGVVGSKGWCKDTTANLWFIGTGGLFMMPSTATLYTAIKPQLMSGESWDAYFRSIDPASFYISLDFDSDTHYLHIFLAPQAGGQGTHLIFDDRNKGLWPQQFPITHGPVVTCQYFGNYDPNSRAILLGGFDGYIRRLDDSALDDDGVAISASLTLGPIKGAVEASILRGMTIDYGEMTPADEAEGSANWNVTMVINGGADVYDVTEGTPQYTGSVTSTLDGRQKHARQRIRGNWHSFQLTNNVLDTYFSFERMELEFSPGGMERRIR